jgi:uncharacterized protein (DUF305 family)
MKNIFSVFKNMQTFSFLIGLVWGAALGLILFSYMVPHGHKAIKMLRHYTYKMNGGERIAQNNRDNFNALYASGTARMPMMDHSKHSSNPYVMSTVTSEKQFLEEMQAHHEAAIIMAQQVLEVPSIHPEVKKLANDIISAQTSEITMMKDWLKLWKY